ncbi:protein of unknown function [Candidatus Nitrosotalea okcheonensis]|uniref:Uncharacterized protein n=1 Tax=Candidatus Nitrosotalea okcheonensis TaxID=1903276 RepID=A0A2H1FCX8_9ARCH|nr:protein of unknown function [Candidatus Nitrosotalea okcheonensis]
MGFHMKCIFTASLKLHIFNEFGVYFWTLFERLGAFLGSLVVYPDLLNIISKSFYASSCH